MEHASRIAQRKLFTPVYLSLALTALKIVYSAHPLPNAKNAKSTIIEILMAVAKDPALPASTSI